MSKSMIQYWDKWNGKINCAKSNKLFTADELRYYTEKIIQMFSPYVEKGDIVVIISENTVIFPLCLMGLLKIGANPIILSSKTSEHELFSVFKVIQFKWVISESGLCNYFNDNRAEIIFESEKIAYENFCSLTKINSDNYSALLESGVILHQTSGTYGKPNLCIRNQDVAIAEAVNYVESIPMYNKIKIRVTTPLHHAFAYGFGLLSSIVSDSTLYIDPVFNPKKVISQETEMNSDILCVVPPMLKLFNMLKQRNSALKLPDVVFYAGMSCPTELANDFEKMFHTKLYTILGTTETGAISTSYQRTRDDCGTGRILKNVCIDVRNKDENNVGDLFVKSSSMMQGYLPLKNNEPINWFYTGDLVRFDEDANLHVMGRKRDIINVDGIKVDPIEIEKVLKEYPGIDDCVVYSGFSKNKHERIFACIVSNIKIESIDIITYCGNKLSHNKVPSQIFFLNRIPRTGSGKCLKSELPYFYSGGFIE